MKTKEHLNMSEMEGFYQWVRGFLSDQREFYEEGKTLEELPAAALEHYNHSIEASNEQEQALSKEQKELFLAEAKRFFGE